MECDHVRAHVLLGEQDAALGLRVRREHHLREILARLEPPARARAAVADLVARELLFEKARGPHLEYIWKHALTRDVAYAGILARHRRRLHAAVAGAIESTLAEDRDSYLAMLGHHREQAGDRAGARPCYLGGARRAAAAFAHD